MRARLDYNKKQSSRNVKVHQTSPHQILDQ